MATLSAPPEEVLLNIAKFPTYSSPALLSLSLCSRRFRHISQTLLYRSVSVYTSREILLLARTLLYRRDLAHAVQHLETEISASSQTHNLTKVVEKQLESTLRQTCQNAETTNKWFVDLWSNRGGASAALLLLLLPNVKRLDVQIWSSSEHLTALMHTAAFGYSDVVAPVASSEHRNSSRPLSQLSDLRLSMDLFSSFRLSPIMQLPTLCSVSVASLSTLGYLRGFHATLSPIQTLDLTHCGLDEVEFFNVLSICSELRILRYHWDKPWSDEDVIDDERDSENDVGPRVIAGLEQSRGTLQVLEVKGDKPLRHDALSLGSLMAFTRLQSLCVPAVMVLNPTYLFLSQLTLKYLPESLKHLHLVDAEIAGEERLESVLLTQLDLLNSFRSLTTLTITWRVVWFWLKLHEAEPPTFRQLRRSCNDRRTGFVLEMAYCSLL